VWGLLPVPSIIVSVLSVVGDCCSWGIFLCRQLLLGRTAGDLVIVVAAWCDGGLAWASAASRQFGCGLNLAAGSKAESIRALGQVRVNDGSGPN